MKTSSLRKGFTLVEIMIVVVIIGLLAALAIPAFKKVRNNAIEKTLLNDARQISSAANQVMSENAYNGIEIAYLAKYLAGGKLSAGVSMVSSTTQMPANVTLNLKDSTGAAVTAASATIAANTEIATFANTGVPTLGTGCAGTLVQGGYFVLRHSNFDKTLSSVTKVTTSGQNPVTSATGQVSPSIAATVVTDLAFGVDTGEVMP